MTSPTVPNGCAECPERERLHESIMDWHKVADARSGEIVRLERRVAELQATLDEAQSRYYRSHVGKLEALAKEQREALRLTRAALADPAGLCEEIVRDKVKMAAFMAGCELRVDEAIAAADAALAKGEGVL